MSKPLLFFTTSSDANFMALTDFQVCDPVILLKIENRKPIMVVKALEFGRASKNKLVDVIEDSTLGKSEIENI